jgi:DMSO/TMAO reductase YedYZ molybdopterin-dependent catalytic subunit
MTDKVERSLNELYQDDPERADALVFGRKTDVNRRGFLGGAGLAAMGAAVGATIPFSAQMPSGLIPVALAQGKKDVTLPGKEGLVVYNDRPINGETPAHLLDPDVTPAERHFVRNNGLVPEMAEKGDPQGWKLVVDGEVNQPLDLTLDELKSRFQTVRLKLQLECGGNGRAGFNPPARGNQWTVGAVGNSEWTGVRLADVLQAAGLKDSAVYTAHYGMDPHLSGDPAKPAISRGVPIWKAMDPYTIIAFEMNGKSIPALNGFPVRLVVPGWPGSASQKWLRQITLRNQVHDGPGMTGMSYRLPAYPVKPGEKVPLEDFRIIESMPVKSVITYPSTGATLPRDNRSIEVRGHAWAGDRSVSRVYVSTDFGATWTRANLERPPNKYSWQRWRARLTFPTKGYYEIWARAVDDAGVTQPFAVAWNPRGYLNNSMHRVAVTVPT